MSNTDKTSLTEEELDLTLQFAEGLYSNFMRYGFMTPYSQNQNLIHLNNIATNKPTSEDMQKALESFLQDTTQLQGYSEFLDIYDTIYGKTLDYFSGMLSYDLSISCKNIKDPKDYKSEEYKKDLKRVYKFLDSFDYKQEFAKVTKQILRTGVSFNWFRDSIGTYNEDTDALEIEKQRNFALQTLPQTECIITGYFNKGSILFDFNMDYFLNDVDINLFDPWFREQNAKICRGRANGEYIPSSKLIKHNGTYSSFTQTSPIDGAWCFKWDAETFNIVPPFASLMKTVLDNETVAKLQIDKDLISAYLLLAGEIGTLDSAKSGEKPNKTKFTPLALGQFMNLVTSGLKKNVKAVAMPLENIRGWQYNDQNPNMSDTQYNTSASQGASASRLIYSSDKMSQSELQNAILNDYNLISKLYRQYENFLEFYINRKTKKYKFSFMFNGSNYIFEREARRKAMNELANLGFVLNTSAWSSVYGFRPQDFDRMLEEAHYSDMQDKLTFLNTKSEELQQSGNPQGEVGISNTTDSELGDSGELGRDYD